MVETSEEKDEEFPKENGEEFPREYCFSTTRTLDPAVKLFGITVKKEAWKLVETSEKIWGYVAGEGEFENRGESPMGPPKRAQNNFWISIGKCVLKNLRSE